MKEEINKEIEKDWCIKITTDNRNDVKNFIGQLKTLDSNRPLADLLWSIGAYYGVTKKGYGWGHRDFGEVSENILTQKQFDLMVKNHNNVVVDNYEMY